LKLSRVKYDKAMGTNEDMSSNSLMMSLKDMLLSHHPLIKVLQCYKPLTMRVLGEIKTLQIAKM
jgi:hypothetical protein